MSKVKQRLQLPFTLCFFKQITKTKTSDKDHSKLLDVNFSAVEILTLVVYHSCLSVTCTVIYLS